MYYELQFCTMLFSGAGKGEGEKKGTTGHPQNLELDMETLFSPSKCLLS